MLSTTDQSTYIFEVCDISKTYTMGDVQVHALRNVSVNIPNGELVVILGESGSGKSTLLNILGGLDVPTSGVVRYRQTEITAATESVLTQYRRKVVGFVFQFYNIIPSLTALENVQLVTDIASNPLGAEEALKLVGLEERKNHFPSQLSGGEQQRIAIARAIAKQPDVLLCDEPTGALDFETGVLVLEVIQRIQRDLRTTVVLITHNASIADMAHRVIRMRSGEIIEERVNTVTRSPRELAW